MDYFKLRDEVDREFFANQAADDGEAEADDEGDEGDEGDEVEYEDQALPADAFGTTGNDLATDAGALLQPTPAATTVDTGHGARYNKLVLNVDAAHRDVGYGSTSFGFTLRDSIKGATKIRLLSAEIPNTWYNFSVARSNVTFEVLGVTYQLPDGCYADMTSVASAMEAVAPVTVAVNTTTRKVTISVAASDTTTAGQVFALSFPDDLGGVLGFTADPTALYAPGQTSSFTGGTSYVSSDAYSFPGDPYLLMELNDYHSLRHQLIDTQIDVFAKITNPTTKGDVLFDDGRGMITKEVTLTAPQTLRKLTVALLDSAGRVIDLGGSPWSFTLEVTYCYSSELNEAYRREALPRGTAGSS